MAIHNNSIQILYPWHWIPPKDIGLLPWHNSWLLILIYLYLVLSALIKVFFLPTILVLTWEFQNQWVLWMFRKSDTTLVGFLPLSFRILILVKLNFFTLTSFPFFHILVKFEYHENVSKKNEIGTLTLFKWFQEKFGFLKVLNWSDICRTSDDLYSCMGFHAYKNLL